MTNPSPALGRLEYVVKRCDMSLPEEERVAAHIAIVDEHIRCENRHDLDAVLATFGPDARYDDQPWGDHRTGRDGVRSYYTELMRALPDLAIEVRHRHVASDSVVLEVTIRGTHLGQWRGLPATGRPLEFPLCALYTFDADDRLAGERIYYDRGVVLGQLGLFHEPLGRLGRIVTALSHPVTIARAYFGHPARARTRSIPRSAA
ncbi:MAG TPA: ester cyclase [Pyrinomonadaceae bacterium]|nr:ester cyclase [Pyrinomonadaceae bacterium]